MSEAKSLDIAAVLKALPHRYPLLLVDRVASLDLGERIHAVKAVTFNEQFFQGHFPSRPIMPGVLQVEALAQAAAILGIETLELAGTGKLVYFMGIDGAKFRAPVEPGCLLDLKVERGFAIRTEPHPRFYTDRTDTAPIAVPALIRNWWPMMFFCVFKAPAEGRTHIFRPGEPFAQIIVIPEEATFDLEPMGGEEAAERELQSRRIYANRPKLSAETEWTSTTDTVFDGTYRHLHRAAKEKARQG